MARPRGVMGTGRLSRETCGAVHEPAGPDAVRLGPPEMETETENHVLVATSAHLSFGSRASRTASPSMMNARTVIARAPAGHRSMWGALRM
ncbi:hypothetical protein M2164_003182 [Streptomyces sp. SAI-208]|nr:hypothetical protein [Streptomyces sp. SAI-090]MDH6548938.1 hypothetical protein [Streptomyces sp. SAI-041]MDH6568008.1 hypothetical protein [Streptomyces sp. SAI-117]MDH6587044.1 hypothetical protein [Streptomyces sp. SAI-133]MDH6607547.1 hypothetical protein [Streptomyces sp. SAI-208]MDH6619185.1 hypothetical protein [Streptomyces sp. SAI-135]